MDSFEMSTWLSPWQATTTMTSATEITEGRRKRVSEGRDTVAAVAMVAVAVAHKWCPCKWQLLTCNRVVCRPHRQPSTNRQTLPPSRRRREERTTASEARGAGTTFSWELFARRALFMRTSGQLPLIQLLALVTSWRASDQDQDQEWRQLVVGE